LRQNGFLDQIFTYDVDRALKNLWQARRSVQLPLPKTQLEANNSTVCPRIEFTRGENFLFLILGKNFRGITFLLHLKPPFLLLKSLFQHRGRLNIKIKENAEKIFSFFFEKIK
jgi:hypothetical protein